MQANAVVLAVKNKKAVVLASGGIFAQIPDQHYFVGQKIVWTQRRPLRRALLMAACLTLLLSSSGWAAAKYLPWTVISVALGETGVQYRLNAWNEVLSAESLTADGQALLDTVEAASHEPLASVMARTLSTLHSEEPDAPVTVEIASRVADGRRAEEAVTQAGQAADIPVALERVPWQDAGKPREPAVQQTPPEAPSMAEPQAEPVPQQPAPVEAEPIPQQPVPVEAEPMPQPAAPIEAEPIPQQPVPNEAELPAQPPVPSESEPPSQQPVPAESEPPSQQPVPAEPELPAQQPQRNEAPSPENRELLSPGEPPAFAEPPAPQGAPPLSPPM